jgi:hypothetical protein
MISHRKTSRTGAFSFRSPALPAWQAVLREASELAFQFDRENRTERARVFLGAHQRAVAARCTDFPPERVALVRSEEEAQAFRAACGKGPGDLLLVSFEELGHGIEIGDRATGRFPGQ